MATYAGTLVKTSRIVRRIAPGFGFLSGSFDLTTYSQTGVEISGITNAFVTDPIVIPNGTSDNGYEVRWDATDNRQYAPDPYQAL